MAKKAIPQEVQAQEAPSMIPSGTLPPPPKEIIPTLEEVCASIPAQMEIRQAVREHYDIGRQISALEKIRKPLTANLKNWAGTLSLAKVLVDDLRMAYYVTKRSSIKEKKLVTSLLNHGISTKVINEILEEATERTDVYNLRTSLQGMDEEEEG